MRPCAFALLATCLASCLARPPIQAQAPDSADPTGDWSIEEGFRLTVDATGFSMPAALAFVPDPGPAPDDPLYFVLELRGVVKVVTNDRTVHTFADLPELGYAYSPAVELSQGGAAGLCLDPVRGHVIVTFIYSDERGQVRYNLIRFDAAPGRFGLSYQSHHDFVDLFSDVVGAITHQIGPCAVRNDELFLSVGDAWQGFQAQNLDSPFGKILRMDLEGNPIAGNPFYGEGPGGGFRDYVWAYGLRNPFGIAFVADRLFVADNGIALDRFMEVEQGQNYLYDGSDGGITTNAQFVWQPSLAPVQLGFVPADALGFPGEFTNTFFVAVAADIERDKIPGIYALPYDVDARRIPAIPGYFVRYEGRGFEVATGLAVGPDGLYFTSLSPFSADSAPVYRITYDPAAAHARTLQSTLRPSALVRQRGCLGCHALYESGEVAGGRYGTGIGPPLVLGGQMLDRLDPRLNTANYEDHLRMLMASETYSDSLYNTLRAEVLAASGRDRIRVWLKHFIQHPDFDKTYIPQMPAVGLSDSEAATIVDYLLEVPGPPSWRDRIRGLLPRPVRALHLVFSFLIGSLVSGVLITAFILLRRRRRPRVA